VIPAPVIPPPPAPPPPPPAEAAPAPAPGSAPSVPFTPPTAEKLPFGAGVLSTTDDQFYSLLSQFIPLIIWLWKKDESPAVDMAGKEALNFHLTAVIALAVLTLANAIPVLGLCIFTPMFALVLLAAMLLCLLGALKTSDGYFYKYPVNLRLIK
jgi:uncharacterized Tic20 family protein